MAEKAKRKAMVRTANEKDVETVVGLASLLWPECAADDLRREFEGLLVDEECAVFLALDGSTAVGFAQCQLRHDYVEGTGTSPVGYLEGICVREGFRHQGIASALLDACEAWAAAKGCAEFASDCELGNDDSIAFHLSAGFTEANRIVCFTKSL